MRTSASRELGLTPLQAALSQVAAVTDVESLGATFGRLERDGVGGPLRHFVSPDERSPEDYVVYLEQGGLGLPTSSYYREEKYAEIRTRTSRTSSACSTSRRSRRGRQGRPHDVARDAPRVVAPGTR